MNSTRYSAVSRGASRAATCVGLSLALSLTLTPIALPAHADEPAAGSSSQAAQDVESLSVRGIDTLSVGGDAFDVATAVGLGGATLYADVSVGGEVRQHDLQYAYDNPQDQAGVISLNAKAGYVASHSGKISLDFYTAATADRQQVAPVLSATVYAVAMSVDGQPAGSVADSLVGIRTAVAGDETQPFEAPRLIVRNGSTYRLAGGASSAAPTLTDGVLYVSYEKVEAADVAASVAYVDEDGNVLLRDELGMLGADESQTVAVRDTVEANGRAYVPVSKMPAVTVSAAQPEVTIHCLPRREASTETQTVSISYTSADGASLMHDKVEVGAGGYLYAPPTVFSQAHSGSVDRYVLKGARDNRGNVYTAEQAAKLSLTLDGAPEFTLEYASENAQLAYTANIALVTPAENGRVSIEVVSSETAQVADGQPANISLPATYERDGETYTRFGSESTLTYTWQDFTSGRPASDTVYYTRSDVQAPEAYQVNVRYVDVASGKQIGGETLTCQPDGQALQISGPEQLEADGTAYQRLSGQEAPIAHGFYAPYRTYTMYYAQPGTVLEGDVTVVRTDVIDGGVRYYTIDPATGAVTADGSAGGLTTGAQYATVTTGSADGEAASAAGGQSDAIAPDGNTAYEERIAESETPLSDYQAGAESGIASIAGLRAWWPAVLAGVAAVAAACIALFVRGRKRKAEGESGSNDIKGA